jgi:transglutaminase-like putative cysteine protease
VLNELTYIRLLETWQNRDASEDAERYPQEIFILSTIPERVLAYEPLAVEPTVLNRRYHPFDFSYSAVSSMSMAGREEWLSVPDLSSDERQSLSEYLEIPLDEENRLRFSEYLQVILGGDAPYFARINTILRSFSTYQYEIGFDDDVSVDKMEHFLYETKQGDCTEFSNTTAILARLAGIPTRVVTGYLASGDLQTGAHRRGIAVLLEKIEALQKYPPQNLFLVTTSHRHSWVQFYMPGYGWVDFETTAYALPPMGGGDPNSMDVVIPLIQEGDEILPEFMFPWILALKTLAILMAAGIAGAYLFRYGRELYLHLLLKTRGVRALKALQMLLLMRLAVEGYAVKETSQTILEYSTRYPELSSFASLYTNLRYRERFKKGEWEEKWQKLLGNWREIGQSSRGQGALSLLRRIFSLKGLRYL